MSEVFYEGVCDLSLCVGSVQPHRENRKIDIILVAPTASFQISGLKNPPKSVPKMTEDFNLIQTLFESGGDIFLSFLSSYGNTLAWRP